MSPSTILDKANRQKLLTIANNISDKHSTIFATKPGWPYFTGYYITLNEITKNKPGYQKKTNKNRQKPQINVIAANHTGCRKFEETFVTDTLRQQFDINITDTGAEFVANHQMSEGEDATEDGTDEEDEGEDEDD